MFLIFFKGPVYRISLAARMSIILSHSEVLLGQNHSDLNCVSMHIYGFCTPKICIETQFKFLWFWPSKTSLWDSMMLILAAREILYTGPLSLLEIMESMEGLQKQVMYFSFILVLLDILVQLLTFMAVWSEPARLAETLSCHGVTS